MSNKYIPNRVGVLMEEQGLNNKMMAELTGYHPSKISRIVNQKTNMDGHDFLNVANALNVHPGDLFVTSHGQVETNLGKRKKKVNPTPRNKGTKPYEFWLSAEDEDSLRWLIQGIATWPQLKDEQLAQEAPGYARIKLLPGRVLLGRAVEEDGKFGDIPATQRISIARDVDSHEDDLSVSRFQCDLTVPVYDDMVGLFARNQGVCINGHELAVGESVFLEHRDNIAFPNGTQLHLDREQTK